MAMTVRTVTVSPHVVGDAVRTAMMSELVQAVAQTLRFVLLNPQTWVQGRFTEPERDMLRMVVERLETATPGDLAVQCPLCGCHSCDEGCALAPVRELAQTPVVVSQQ
jgi:hypothetical protein